MLVAPVLTLLLHAVVLRAVGPALTCTLGGVSDTAGLLPLRTCCALPVLPGKLTAPALDTGRSTAGRCASS